MQMLIVYNACFDNRKSSTRSNPFLPGGKK
jgi:hypothetical protein